MLLSVFWLLTAIVVGGVLALIVEEIDVRLFGRPMPGWAVIVALALAWPVSLLVILAILAGGTIEWRD